MTQAAASAPPANLLFITADQWRGECLSARGHPQIRTPNLDRLAAEGTLFRRHYAQATPCGPSRASLHTGMYLQNHRSGTNGTPLDARHTNWAIELRGLGHEPALFGYTDTSPDPRAYAAGDPILRSYEGPLPGIDPVVLMGENPIAWAEWLAARGYDVPENPVELYLRKREGAEWEAGGPAPLPLAVPAEHHDTAFMVESTLDWIRARSGGGGGRGWVAHLSLLRPHPPWVAPEPYNSLYPPDELPGFERASDPDEQAALHPWLAYQLAQRHYRAPEDERKLRRLKASYFGLMSEVDTQLGRLFDALREMGEWDRTLVIFTSDHGEQIGDHWLLGKCGWFDASYHIPLIVRDPRPEANPGRGTQVDAFTENIDIMPSLLDWLGAPRPLQCDGESLAPFLRDPKGPGRWRAEAHWESDFREPEHGRVEAALGLSLHQCTLNVLRGERYKYVHFTALPALLFDLERDPAELVDRSRDPDYAPVLLECAQRMLSWRMNHDEQTLTHLSLTPDGVVSRPSPRYA